MVRDTKPTEREVELSEKDGLQDAAQPAVLRE